MPKWTKDNMANAIDSVNRGEMSIRKAAFSFEVPYTTLNDKINHRYSCLKGGQTILSHACESLLATLIAFMADIGFGLHKLQILDIVSNIRVLMP